MKFRHVWSAIGPGILLAAASIGASHLVLSPRAGADFGFQLLWLVPLCHILKYPAFEFGPRYAAATGQNLLQGYARIPGPRRWPLLVFLVSTVSQGIGVLAAVVGIAGAVLWTWCASPAWPTWLSAERLSAILIALIVLLLVIGGFSWLDHLNKLMMAVLAVATVAAFVPIFPTLQEWSHMGVPRVPDGSTLLIAGMLGWMPTGIDVSVWHSFWTIEKNQLVGKDPLSPRPDPLQRLRLALFDMRLGYLLSFATGVMFITMGAVHLSGRSAALDGPQFAQELSTAYTATFGPWFYHVFMLTALFAMFSTSYTVIDGFSRSYAECCAILNSRWSKPSVRRGNYFGFMLITAVLACVILTTVGNPVTMVLAATLISLAAAPLLYGFNLYCVIYHIDDPKMRPSITSIIVGLFGVAFMLFVLGMTGYLKLSAD